MPRPVAVIEHAMEAQVACASLRKVAAPLWEAAIASGDWNLLAECKALSTTIRIASVQLRRIAGRAETLDCPDDIAKPGHGAAA
jgi:hypothetical protein